MCVLCAWYVRKSAGATEARRGPDLLELEL